MAEWNEHVLKVSAALDDKSKEAMRDAVRAVFTDGANINFNNKENIKSLHRLADIMRRIFSTAGNTSIDFAAIMKKSNPNEIFDGLKQAATEFENAWSNIVSNFGSFNLKDMFMEDLGGLSMAADRLTGKMGKTIARNIEAAFSPIKTTDINKLLKSAAAAERSFVEATSWEERTSAALKYLNVYEKIGQLRGVYDPATIEKSLIPVFKRVTDANYKLGGQYVVSSLQEAIPQMQTSLQNAINMVLGKPLIGLTESGRVDVEFVPVVIKTLDIGDFFKRKTDGPVNVPVGVEITDEFKEKLATLYDLNKKSITLKGADREAAAKEFEKYYDEIIAMFPEEALDKIQNRLDRFFELKSVNDKTLGTLWRDFSGYGFTGYGAGGGSGSGTGTGLGSGTGDGTGSGDASSAELEAERARNTALQADLTSANSRAANAEDRAAQYSRAMDSMQEEMDSLREQLANSGHGTGDGFAPLFSNGTPLDEKEVAMVAKYLDIMKLKMGENYNEAEQLKAALDLVFDIKNRNIENMMGRFTNGNAASNAVLKMATGMEVNNQKNRDAALRSIDETEYDRIVAEQKAAMSEDKTEFQRKWEELASAMIGEDAFKDEDNLVKGKIAKAFEELGGTAKEGIDKVNKMWLAGELEGKEFKNKYIQAYVNHLNEEKEYYDGLKDAQAGEMDIDGLFSGQSDLKLTEEKAQALRDQAAAYEALIAKKKEEYGIGFGGGGVGGDNVLQQLQKDAEAASRALEDAHNKLSDIIQAEQELDWQLTSRGFVDYGQKYQETATIKKQELDNLRRSFTKKSDHKSNVATVEEIIRSLINNEALSPLGVFSDPKDLSEFVDYKFAVEDGKATNKVLNDLLNSLINKLQREVSETMDTYKSWGDIQSRDNPDADLLIQKRRKLAEEHAAATKVYNEAADARSEAYDKLHAAQERGGSTGARDSRTEEDVENARKVAEYEAQARADAEAKEKADKRRNELAEQLELYADDGTGFDLEESEAQKAALQEILNTLKQENLLTDELKARYDAINSKIDERINLLKSVRQAYDSLETADNIDYNMYDADEVQQALDKRKEIINAIPQNVLDNDDDIAGWVEEIEQGNLELEKRIGLLQQVKQGLIDIDSVDDIMSESGDLDSKLSRLQDVASAWGSNIKDGEVDEDDDAIEALEEFEATYDRIVLKLANGRKIEILPNAKGLRALYKYDDGIDSGAYGETEIEDIEFVRKEMQRVEQAAQEAKQAVGVLNNELKTAGDNADNIDDKIGGDSVPGAGTGQADGATTEEVENLERVRQKASEITNEVKEKTQEFLNEQTAVKKAAQSEVHSLGEVEKKVNAIRVALSNVNTLLSNIKKGKDVGSGLSNININVNHKKDKKKGEPISINQDSLKSVLENIVYKVKIAHDDTDKQSNKIAIGAEALEGVLKRVFNPTAGIDAGQQSAATATGIDVNSVKAETDVLIEQYRGILRTIEEWKALYAQLQTIQASSTTDLRKQMLPMLENMSPELVKMIGGSFAENFAKGFKGVKTKDILSSLSYITNADLLGSVTDQVDMLSKIDFSKFSFDGLEIKETNIEFLREVYELLKKIDEKKKVIAGASEIALADGVESEQPKESYALDKTLLDVKKVLDKIAQNTASLNGVEIQRAVEQNTVATEQVAPSVGAEVSEAVSGSPFDKTIERRKIQSDGENIYEVPDKRTYVSSKKTDESYKTRKEHTRIDYDENGKSIETTTLVEIIDDFDKIRKENDKTQKAIDRAQKKVAEFVAKFQSKTGGNAQYVKGFSDLQAFTAPGAINAENIDDAYNQMILLQQKYAELEANFRKGQSSLNPFVNAINKSQNITNIFGEVETKFNDLTVKSEDLISNFTKLSELRNSIEEYTSKMLKGTMSYDDFEKFSVAMGEFTSTKTKVDGLIRSEAMNSKNLVKDYEKLGKLRAKFEGSGDLKDREELRILAEKVAKSRESLDLTSEEIQLLRAKSEESYKSELRLVNAAKQQKAIDDQKKAAEKASESNKKETSVHKAQVEAEVVKELIKLYEQLGKAQATGNEDEASRLRSVISTERSKLSSVDYATDMKFKDAKSKGFAAERAQAEKDALRSQEEIIKRLNKLYQEYGILVERAGAASGNFGEQLKTEVLAKAAEIQSLRDSMDFIAPEMLEGFDEAFDRGRQIESTKQYEALAKKSDADEITRLKNIERLEKEIGKLRADADAATNVGVKNSLEEEIELREHLIELQKQGLEMEAQDEAYYRQVAANRTRQAKKNATQETRERKAAFNDAKKLAQREALLGKAGTAVGRAENTWMNAAGIEEVLPADFNAKIDEYYQKLDALRKKHQELKNSEMISEEQKNELINQTMSVNKMTEEIGELVAEYQRLSGDNTTVIGTSTLDSGAGLSAYEQQLKQTVMTATNGKAQIKNFDAATKTLTYTVKTGKNEFTEYTAAVRRADGALVSVQGATKRTETFIEATKRKMKELTSYFSGMAIFNRVGQELRRGIQYVREIDLALTELKKVTDETEETYDRFLETAAKTADKVGSTIQKVVSSTADWARLGYSMKEAAEFAESTQILMNVSEFTDVSQATDTLISAVQAFGYTAETSMDVVDLLNTIGNNYAISTADLAKSLTKSSASLVAAGGNLAEAAALTATANAIIQDADSVGTALKTTSLRLRGTSVKVLEEEGLDSDGAVESTSKLRSQVLATSGVDILTDTGAYKSTYQILLEIAEVWDQITDDKARAGLLELLAGKRNSSVIAALLQNPEDLKAAYEDAMDAEGSALKENERYLDSIQGKIDQFNNAMQAMWNNTLDSDWVKLIVEAGTSLIKIIDNVGLLQTALFGLFTYLSNKKNGSFDLASILGIHDKGKGWTIGQEGFTGWVKEVPGKINGKFKKKSIVEDVVGNPEDINIDAKEYAEAISDNINDYVKVDTSQIDTQIEDIQNKLMIAREQLDDAKSADWDYYKSLGSYAPAKDRDNRIAEKQNEISSLEAQLTTLQAKRSETMSDAALKYADANINGIKAETQAQRSLFEAIDRVRNVKLSMGNEQDAALKIDQINQAASQGQVALSQYAATLGDSDMALQAYIASLNGEKASLAGFNQFIQQHNAGIKASGIAAKAAAVGHALLNAAISMGISLIISAAISAITALINKHKELAEKAQEVMNEYQNATKTLKEHHDTIQDIREDYEDLADGVDALGNNVSLTSEEYERYNEIANQIAEMFPQMVSGYTAEGNAIIALKGNVEELTKAYEEEARAARDAILVGQNKVFDDFLNNATSETGGWRWNNHIGYNDYIDIIQAYIDASSGKQSIIDSGILNEEYYNFGLGKMKEDLGYSADSLDWEADLASLQALLRNVQAEAKAASSGVRSVLNAYLAQDFDYLKLSDDAKNAAQSIIDQFDTEFYAQFDSASEMEAWVTANLVKPLQDANTSAEFEAAFDLQTKFNKGEVSVKEYEDGIISLIDSLGLENSDDIIKSIRLVFDVDDSGLVDSSTQNVAKGLLNAADQGKVSTLTKTDLDIVDKYAKEFEEDMSGVGYTWDAFIAKINEKKLIDAFSPQDFEKVSNGLDAIQSAYNSLSDAVEQYNNAGYLTLDSLQSILSLEPEYLALLQMENGQLSINQAAAEAMIQAKLAEAEANAIQSAMTQLETLAKEAATKATNDNATAATNAITSLGNYSYALGTVAQDAIVAAGAVSALNNAVNGAKEAGVSEEDINAVMSNLDTYLSLINTTRQNLSTSFVPIVTGGTGGNPKKEEEDTWLDEKMEEFQREMDYWENRIGANQSKYEQLQNEIDLLEAKGQKANATYYREQITLENQRMHLLQGQKRAAKEYLATLDEGSEEWF